MKKTAAIDLALQAAEDKKAVDMQVIDVRAVSTFTDHMVVMTGLNKNHSRAIADAVEEQLAEVGVMPYRKQGYQQGEWIVLDYLDFVVHILLPAAREYYQLERLWQP